MVSSERYHDVMMVHIAKIVMFLGESSARRVRNEYIWGILKLKKKMLAEVKIQI